MQTFASLMLIASTVGHRIRPGHQKGRLSESSGGTAAGSRVIRAFTSAVVTRADASHSASDVSLVDL
jgi:hypothetical protein